MNGWIVYKKNDANKNVDFIQRVKKYFNDKGVDLALVYERNIILHNYSKLPDFVIYRSRNYKTAEFFERNNVKVFGSSKINRLANDKKIYYEFLKKINIPFLPYEEVTENTSIFEKCVLKRRNGHGGNEVYLIKSNNDLNKIVGKKYKNKYIIQKYSHLGNTDIRLYFIDKKLIIAVERSSNVDFRSNHQLGGSVRKIDPPKQVLEYANEIISYLDSSFVGIDFINTEKGYVANELEDPVGSRSVYCCSNIDIIDLFCAYIFKSLINN